MTKLVFFSTFACPLLIEAIPTLSFCLSTSLSKMTEKAYINAFYFSDPQKVEKVKKGQSSFWFLEKSILKSIKIIIFSKLTLLEMTLSELFKVQK